MVVSEVGCIIHKAVQFNRCYQGTSIFICGDCGTEFIENEDTGCGG